MLHHQESTIDRAVAAAVSIANNAIVAGSASHQQQQQQQQHQLQVMGSTMSCHPLNALWFAEAFWGIQIVRHSQHCTSSGGIKTIK